MGFAVMLLVIFAPTASATDEDLMGSAVADGARISTISEDEFAEMDAHFWKGAKPRAPFFEYGVGSVCGGAPGDMDGGNECGAAGMCERRNSDVVIGPPIAAWRREVDAAGRPVDGATWVKIGNTCRPERIPGNERALTMAMIQAAFHDTEFTVPSVNIQPEGDVTLVNLPTYFEVKFPSAAFGPDEVDQVDPARVLGHTVQVRPRLKSVTYHLGERTVGPTTSLGGPYPSGDVTATYTQPGTHEVRVDITYTGQYRLGSSGPWLSIPGEVVRRGTVTTLVVREAKSRLYTS